MVSKLHFTHCACMCRRRSILTRLCSLQGTVLIHNAQELQDYSRSEENKLAELIQGIADSGATVVAAGSSIGEMAMHFLEKHGIMVLRCGRV
jgi:T-complex protein 1 subunit theta